MVEFVVLGVLLVLGLGAYWSLVIYPRQREFQKQQKYVNSLNPGDEMITFGESLVAWSTSKPRRALPLLKSLMAL